MTLLPIYTFCAFSMLFASLTVFLRSAFASSLVSSLFSASCAILYFFLNSPDVSMTEVSIAVFISTAIYLMTARIVRVEFFEKPKLTKIFITLILFVVMLFLSCYSINALGTFGEVETAVNGSSKIHLFASTIDYHIPNVVTTILASFRAFDTLGETIIILTSSIGIFLILESKSGKFSSL